MRNLLLFIIGLFLLSCGENQQIGTDTSSELPDTRIAVQCVNPFIGTGGHGHTFPGATLPFGMVQLSPDTRLEGWDGCSGYHYSDSIVYGFSHTHLSGTGVSDYGDVLVMPTTGELQLNNGYEMGVDNGYASRFSKDSEKASPGYYSVHLDDYDIDVRLTSTTRTGIQEYTFNQGGGNIIIDLTHRDQLLDYELTIVNDSTLEGYRISNAWAEEQHVYFVAVFSHPFTNSMGMGPTTPMSERSSTAPNPYITALEFDLEPGEKIMVKTGISATGIAGARKNLEAEAPHWDFEQYKADAEAAWAAQLGKIEIQGGTPEQRTIFYTSLYHTMIAPNLYNDVDGKYRGHDGEIHEANHDVYTVFSLWDTFRATHPLYTIIEQDRTEDFIKTFLLQYEQAGLLPVWELAGNETFCMIGYHSASVITDAYVKGIRGFDADLALEAMVNSANQDHHGLEAYKAQGFIGAGDDAESVSKTLEYAYDDWCIAVLADSLGQTDIANEFYTRSKNWINLFDPETGFMRARMNGGWQPNFQPDEVNFNFTEANSWQYSAFVPHDIETLIEKHGGDVQFEAWLNELFTTSSETSGREQADITGLIGQYAHGNEPSHHMAYLYHYVGQPWESAYRVRQIMDELYTDQPDGLSGNEDCGQMSAWYVMSAMGFYPVTPGSMQYAIGSPLFDKVTIHLENGNDFVIECNRMEEKVCVIREAKRNDHDYHNSYIDHSDIMDGASFNFQVGNEPVESWWIGTIPRSKTEADFHPVPVVHAESMSFTDSLHVYITCPEPFHYCTSFNQEECRFVSDTDLTEYIADFWITDNTGLYAWNSLEGMFKTLAYRPPMDQEPFPGAWIPRKSVFAQFNKIDPNVSISLLSEYANQYAAGGGNALIDGIRGPDNFRTGFWQGYQGQDVVAVIDLGEERHIKSVQLGALQDIKSWIWFPESVRFSFSEDGENWKNEVIVENHAHIYSYLVMRNNFTGFRNTTARYVKVEAINRGPCPDWHLGAGGASWIFVDEIVINTQH